MNALFELLWLLRKVLKLQYSFGTFPGRARNITLFGKEWSVDYWLQEKPIEWYYTWKFRVFLWCSEDPKIGEIARAYMDHERVVASE